MSKKPPPKRTMGRRRRANVAGGRKHRHAVLVTPEEEALLVQRAEAQRVTVPRLVVESALSEGGETPTQRRRAMAELFAIRRALAGDGEQRQPDRTGGQRRGPRQCGSGEHAGRA